MHHLCTACNGCAMHDECAKRIAGAMSVQCAMGAQRALRVQIRCANQVCKSGVRRVCNVHRCANQARVALACAL